MAPKVYRKAKKYVKKRYTNKKGAPRLGRLARDVAMIQRSLNVEHKHFDNVFGSGHALSAFTPTKATPTIHALALPTRGTAFNDRVGNQIKITHMTMKLIADFHNNTDLIQRTSMTAQILFSKSADDVPTIEKLYHPDANGHYTNNSFANTQEWKKYTWIKGLTCMKSYVQPTNRYPVSDTSGLTGGPRHDDSGNIDVTVPAQESLNIATFYLNKQVQLKIKTLFENGSETEITQMKPYLLIRTDVVEAAGLDYDPISVSGQIRFTYVDN